MQNAVLGANDCMQLNHLNVIARELILKQHMQNGVEIPCTDGVVIGPNVTLGKGNRIFANDDINREYNHWRQLCHWSQYRGE